MNNHFSYKLTEYTCEHYLNIDGFVNVVYSCHVLDPGVKPLIKVTQVDYI